MRNVFLVSFSILTALFTDLPYYCDLGFEYVATELGHVESYNANNAGNNVNNTLDSNQCFLFHTRLLVLEHAALKVKNIRDWGNKLELKFGLFPLINYIYKCIHRHLIYHQE